MRAFVLKDYGGLDQLQWHTDWPVPEPGAHEVLIKVHACGLNNTDINTRTGWYSKRVTEQTTGSAFAEAVSDRTSWGGCPLTFPRIQGADVCGTVVSAGNKVNVSLIGKRVLIDPWLRNYDSNGAAQFDSGYLGSERDGGFAEFMCVHNKQAFPIYSPLKSTELATFATSYVTAENMLNRANVTSNDRVLITGASGGVGSALIQLAARRGAQTIAQCGKSKRTAVESIKPDLVLSREEPNIPAALETAFGYSSVTVVADVVGGKSWPSLIDLLSRGGRYTCAGAIGGPIVEFDLRTFYLRDLTFTGATQVPDGVFADLVLYIERGEISPLLAATYPLEALHEAQKAFVNKSHVGNIVVQVD